MIIQIQQTLILLAALIVLGVWLDRAWSGKDKQPPLWVVVVSMLTLIFSIIGVIGIAFYRVWA